MAASDDSRRDFLRRFAALSPAPLVTGLCAACRENAPIPVYGPSPVYGPVPPANPTTVSGIYFRDAQGGSEQLAGSNNVPVRTEFEFRFTNPMNTSVLPTVSLVDSNSTGFACVRGWSSTTYLIVTPSAALAPNTAYVLGLGADARDAFGGLVQLTSTATASFRTGAA